MALTRRDLSPLYNHEPRSWPWREGSASGCLGEAWSWCLVSLGDLRVTLKRRVVGSTRLDRLQEAKGVATGTLKHRQKQQQEERVV